MNVQKAPEMIPASVSPVWGHSAPVCSQCVYNGETFLGGGWCNGECHWIDQECLPITTRTDLKDDNFERN